MSGIPAVAIIIAAEPRSTDLTSGWPMPPALNSLVSRAPFSQKRHCRDKSPDHRIEKIRPPLYRGRRLDLRAVARRVLSGEARAGKGAAICQLETDLDRDQRHLLRLAEAGEFPQMGA